MAEEIFVFCVTFVALFSWNVLLCEGPPGLLHLKWFTLMAARGSWLEWRTRMS